MARSKRMSVNKRLREKKKAEAAELKRAMRSQRGADEGVRDGGRVADYDDLVGFGVAPGPSGDSAGSA